MWNNMTAIRQEEETYELKARETGKQKIDDLKGEGGKKC